MTAYPSISLQHDGGVTEIRFHTDGEPLRWNREAASAFVEVAADRETKVVIVTGTGDAFCTSIDHAGLCESNRDTWDETWWHEKRLLRSLLDIDVPAIRAVNGPAFIHAEIPLLADVVLAANSAVFADKTHFVVADRSVVASGGVVPGDGVHLVWPWLIEHRKAKYFLLAGQEIGAAEALQLGFVNDFLAQDELRPRAWEPVREWAQRPLPLLRYTREALNTFERQYLLNGLVDWADARPGRA
jgi:enoyl-CoA hydratase/carnithine racemase